MKPLFLPIIRIEKVKREKQPQFMANSIQRSVIQAKYPLNSQSS